MFKRFGNSRLNLLQRLQACIASRSVRPRDVVEASADAAQWLLHRRMRVPAMCRNPRPRRVEEDEVVAAADAAAEASPRVSTRCASLSTGRH